MGIRYTHYTKCFECGKDHHGNRRRLVISLKDFKTYCAGECAEGKELITSLDNDAITEKINEIYSKEFADELRLNFQKTFSVRPAIPQVYYMMQLAKRLKAASWNEVIKYIIEDFMLRNPLSEQIKENPIGNKPRLSQNQIVSNPFETSFSHDSIAEAEIQSKPEEEEPEEPIEDEDKDKDEDDYVLII